MPIQVTRLKKLPFVEDNNETVLKVEELVRFLRKHVTEGVKAIRIDNLKLELSKKKELRTVDANTFVTFQGVIVYIFNHINDYAICQTIAAEISKVLCGKTDDGPKSILELYRDIANVNFLQPFGKIAINENNLQTLHINYKANFSENEWEQICRFELKNICEIGQHVNRDISEFITENEQRKEASELINGETVKLNNIIHTYNGLRQSVENYQEYIFKQKPTVTVTECLPSQCINHTNGVHAFVECKAETDLGSLEEQATLVRSDLNKTHGVVVPEVIFLEENTLNGYSCKQCTNDNYHKFHLRDDYFSGKLGNKIVHVLQEYDEDYIDLLEPKTLKHQDNDDNVYCEYCFQKISSHIFKPLDWKRFDLLKEWYLEVPLELQTIFGNLFYQQGHIAKI
ncbi:unnamed protein product [Mytilus coruscus]|uniref:Uncharacterized protein n=1 Tax=Mytilus coruscus TaxID=42192 RepID=A0A6J8A6N2_MYTCO|nr:unnamed protein product [Mytilus coruscus]